MRRLLWFVVVVLVLAVVADRVADYAAERVVADHLRTDAKLTKTPAVDIAGFPFLTQFAHRRYAEVTATASDVPIGSGSTATTLDAIRFVFRDVTTNRDFSSFSARSGTARATLSYAALGRLLDLTVGYAGDNKVRVSKKLSIAGASFSPSFTVEPGLVDGALRFTNATLAAGIPSEVGDALRGLFDLDVPLTDLPLGTRVKSLTADARGVELSLAGQDLTYRT